MFPPRSWSASSSCEACNVDVDIDVDVCLQHSKKCIKLLSFRFCTDWLFAFRKHAHTRTRKLVGKRCLNAHLARSNALLQTEIFRLRVAAKVYFYPVSLRISPCVYECTESPRIFRNPKPEVLVDCNYWLLISHLSCSQYVLATPLFPFCCLEFLFWIQCSFSGQYLLTDGSYCMSSQKVLTIPPTYIDCNYMINM